MKMETNDRSILVFEEAIKSEETRKQYRYLLKKFVEYVKKEYPDVLKASDLLQLNDDYLQKQLEDYLIFCKKRIGHSTIKVRFSALELFFAMNDRILNFKKIKKMFPQKIKVLGGHPWTTSEIKKILESTTSLRNKAIIYFISSTGCRIGALQNLRVEHISKVHDDCKSVLFYAGSNEEYYGFLTPESSKALEEYFEERRKNGESLNPKSPLFRKEYKKLGIAKAEPMNLQTYRTSLFPIFNKVRFSKGENRRHDIPIFHGFRIRFNTILKMNKEINPNIVERLLGHFSKAMPLDTSYFKPKLDDLFIEFRKAIIELTIDDSIRLEYQNRLKDQKIKDLESDKDRRISDLEKKFDNMKKLLEKANAKS